MKTAISIPDTVFNRAERLARRLRKSRSQLYSEALAEYLDRHDPDEITEAMNRALKSLDEAVDPFVASVSQRVLEGSEW